MPTPVLFVLAILVFAVVVLAASLRAEKARTEKLRQASLSAGYAFEATLAIDRLRALGDLPLFTRGHSVRAWNVVTARHAGEEVKIFDFSYAVGSGKRRHTWDQTIALYAGAGIALPEFLLSPENPLFHWASKAQGYHDIDFDSNPDFSSRYLLWGPDEAAIRSAFTPGVQGALLAVQGWSVEAKEGAVAVYRAGQRMKPEELAVFVAQSRAVLEALASR